VRLEISPQPAPDERAAILVALNRAGFGEADLGPPFLWRSSLLDRFSWRQLARLEAIDDGV